jgi:hypothetical protein
VTTGAEPCHPAAGLNIFGWDDNGCPLDASGGVLPSDTPGAISSTPIGVTTGAEPCSPAPGLNIFGWNDFGCPLDAEGNPLPNHVPGATTGAGGTGGSGGNSSSNLLGAGINGLTSFFNAMGHNPSKTGGAATDSANRSTSGGGTTLPPNSHVTTTADQTMSTGTKVAIAGGAAVGLGLVGTLIVMAVK